MITICLLVFLYLVWKKKMVILNWLLTTDNEFVAKIRSKFFASYEKMGSCYRIPIGEGHIYLPLNKGKIFEMSDIRVELVKGQTQINITQPPGYPYLVSAQDLDGDLIIVKNFENDTETKVPKNEKLRPYLDY